MTCDVTLAVDTSRLVWDRMLNPRGPHDELLWEILGYYIEREYLVMEAHPGSDVRVYMDGEWVATAVVQP